MSESVIRSEGETLDEARARLPARIPPGAHPVSEKVLSDGTPLARDARDLTVEAESVDAARAQARSQTPAGFEITREAVLNAGSRGTARATSSYGDQEALRDARRKVPKGAVITSEKVREPGVMREVQVLAFDESAARAKAQGPAGRSAIVTALALDAEGKKGFLGIGRKPGRYTVHVTDRPASVEIDYQIRARIRVSLARLVKTPAAIEVAVVEGVDGLLAALEKTDGLHGPRIDRRRLFQSLEGVHDERVGRALVSWVRRSIRRTDGSRGRDGPVGELLALALESLERLGDASIRGEAIELVFDHLTAFVGLPVPDLFGRYTPLLRALVTAFTGEVASSKVGWRDNDGYETWLRYDTGPLQEAFTRLCAVESRVSTNLLHKLAALPRIEVPRGYSDKGDPGVEDPTDEIDLRRRAQAEIARRGSPPHDAEAYGAVDEYA